MQAQSDRTMILSVDPGYTTGVVLAQPNGTRGITLIAAIEVNWPQRFDIFGPLIATHAANLDAIVIERFKLFNKPESIRSQIGSEFPSCRVIGTVETYAVMAGLFDRIVYQEPWAKRYPKSIDPNDWLMLGGSFHNADAYRHAWYFARTSQRRRQREAAKRSASR